MAIRWDMARSALRRVMLLAAVAAGPSLVSGAAGAVGGPELSIGFIGALSGAGANISQDQIDGFKLGIKHLGGRIGGAEYELTVIDDKRDPQLDRRAARQLLDSAKTQVILLSASAAVSEMLAPIVAASRSFLIALNDPSPKLAGRSCSANYFSLAPLDETLNGMAGVYLQNQGYRAITIAAPDMEKAKASAAEFSRGFKGAVSTVVSHHGTMNFSHDLDRIRDLSPDAVYLLHTGGMAVNFIIQFQRSKLKGRFPLFGPATTFDQTVIAAAGGAAADLFSVAPWSSDFDTPSNRRMMADFEVEYGRPASIYAAYGYDAAMLLDRAVASIDRRFNDEEMMRTAMRRVEFPSTRPGFRFDTNHFPVETFVVREVVQDDTRGRLSNEQRGLLVRDVRDGRAGECPMRWSAEPVQPPKTERR